MKLREAIKILHEGKHAPLPITHMGRFSFFTIDSYEAYRKFDNAFFKVGKYRILNWILRKIKYI
jgi:hypothetical protein